MYTYVSSLVLPKKQNSKFINIDIRDYSLNYMFLNYRQIFIKVTDSSNNVVYSDLNRYRKDLFNSLLTVNQWLNSLTNQTLITSSNLPSNVNYGRYDDILRLGYKLDKPVRGVNVPLTFSSTDNTTAVITRPELQTDFNLLNNYCLISLNGFLHNFTTDSNTLYLQNAINSLLVANNNTAGFINFYNIGSISRLPLNPTAGFINIYGQSSENDLKNRTYFSTINDLTNKTVILVLGGYLQFLEPNVFWQVSNNSFAINWSNIPLIDRILESKNYIDLTSLGLTTYPTSPNAINTNEVFSNEILLKYMSLSQSFLVIINTPSIFQNTYLLRKNASPGLYIGYEKPIYPLVIGKGRLQEYWWEDEGNGIYSISVDDNLLSKPTYKEELSSNINIVNPNNLPNHKHCISPGYFLEIGSII